MYYHLLLFTTLIHILVYEFLEKYSIRNYNFLKKHDYLLPFIIFFIYLVFTELFKIQPNLISTIYCDNYALKGRATIEGADVNLTLTGEVLQTLVTKFGGAAVMISGAKIIQETIRRAP